VDEGRKVADEVNKEIDAANQVTQKDDDLTSVLADATGRFNAGDESGANATLDSQGRQVLSDEQALKSQQIQALTQAQDAERKLREALAR